MTSTYSGIKIPFPIYLFKFSCSPVFCLLAYPSLSVQRLKYLSNERLSHTSSFPLAHPHTQPIHLITYLLFTAWYLLIVFSFFIQNHIHQFLLPFYQLQLSSCWKSSTTVRVAKESVRTLLLSTPAGYPTPLFTPCGAHNRVFTEDLRMRSTVGLEAAHRAAASEEARSVNCADLPRAALPAYSRGSVSQIAVISVLAR